jgi:hypothetical protein
VSDANAAALVDLIVRGSLSERQVARELGVTAQEVLDMCAGRLAVGPQVLQAVRMLAGGCDE